LKQVRTQGYAVDNSEFQEEVKSVPGPVLAESGHVVAGFSIAGPVYRMHDEVLLRKIIPEVKKQPEKYPNVWVATFKDFESKLDIIN